MFDAVIVHSAEICLKGDNRNFFETRLATNLRRRLAGLGDIRVAKSHASLIVTRAEGQIDLAAAEEWRRRLKTVFGCAKFLFVRRVPRDLAAIAESAAQFAAASGAATFKIEVRRLDKSFPQDSMEIARFVGGAVLDVVPGIKVDVHDPALRLVVEIGQHDAFVSPGAERGAAGLPVGVSGKLVSLLSGGIDSPVASWKALRRGSPVIYVHCHSYPYVGAQSLDKVRRLAARLAAYQPESVLYLVPIGDLQREIAAKCDPAYRIVLYRRMMMRAAEIIAHRVGALGIVTGDSVGQVASQTLENLATVTAAVSMPIYRPLVSDDKDDIVAVAKRINTFDISIEPHDDCCSVFMPPRPVLRSTPEHALAEERKLDWAPLLAAAIDAAETHPVTVPDEPAEILI